VIFFRYNHPILVVKCQSYGSPFATLDGNLMKPTDPSRLLSLLIIATTLPATAQTAAASVVANVQSPPAVILPASGPIAPNPASPAMQVLPSPPLPDPTPEELGDSLEAHQRYQAAIAAYRDDSHPSAAVWNKMGIAYQMMFSQKDAVRCYKESLKLNPKSPMVYNNLGTVYDSVKDYSNAERMYKRALKIEPKSPLILKNLGTNLLVQRKYSKGWDAYQKAMALDPAVFQDHDSPTVSNPTSLHERGAMNYFMARGCVRMGQIDCAVQYLRLALNEGYTTIKKVSLDADFASLLDNPAYKALVQEQQQPPQQHP
jgi:Flp pilus assembly protein TadD